MTLSKNQKVLIGIFLLGILIYFLFYKKKPIKRVIGVAQFFNLPKKDVVKDENEEPIVETKEEVAIETNYIGSQDCIESCDMQFDIKKVHCFNTYGDGNEKLLGYCLSIAERQRGECLKKCPDSYPTNQNFNADVRDNFKAIINKPLPSYYDLRLKIDMHGKKSVFPFEIVKITEDAMELPNRRSLLNQDAKYKYIDVAKNDKIKIVALTNLSYTVDHFAFNDDFLLTDKDYVISYSQAVQHFELV